MAIHRERYLLYCRHHSSANFPVEVWQKGTHVRVIAQPLIIGLMLVGAVAIGVAFVFKTLALLSWLVALLAIISASVILLRQPYK